MPKDQNPFTIDVVKALQVIQIKEQRDKEKQRNNQDLKVKNDETIDAADSIKSNTKSNLKEKKAVKEKSDAKKAKLVETKSSKQLTDNKKTKVIKKAN